MAELLQVDIETLQKLGSVIAVHAGTVNGIEHTVEVSMNGSAVEKAATDASAAVIAAYKAMGSSLDQMATAAQTGAKTYEAVEQASTALMRSIMGETGQE
ncbi:hypothetical protein [Nocardia sp. CC201C]|uniref:hypothetical protein n=1 Tax=Nocardia sp. CC201C TaxID=3044575 RepID=UPI0024A87E07|nr:hypothetical protein [Nocardia sp. CC201C]